MKSILYIFLAMILALSSITLSAQTKSKKVQNLERQRKAAMEEIQKTNKELNKISKDKSKKQKEVNLLKKKVGQRQKVINLLDAEIKALNGDIDSLQRQEKYLKGEEELRKEAYARSVVALQHRKSTTDPMLFVLSSEAFDQAVRRMRFVSQYALAHQQASAQLKETRLALEQTRFSIEANRNNKSTLLVQREKECNLLQQEQKQRISEVQQLQGKEKDLKALRRKQQQQIATLNKKIEQQIAFEIAEAERKAREEQERRAREAAARGGKAPIVEERKAATKGGYPMTAEERKLGGSFAQNKGNLPAPVNNNYQIVGRFGVQQHNQLSKVQTNNNGIDLEVPNGTSARAVFDGVVTSVFVIEGAKVAVIIRHGNYLTVYSNITNVVVKKGQKVKAHQPLGRVAVDSFSNKAILNFQVWHERTKQNPSSWIR